MCRRDHTFVSVSWCGIFQSQSSLQSSTMHNCNCIYRDHAFVLVLWFVIFQSWSLLSLPSCTIAFVYFETSILFQVVDLVFSKLVIALVFRHAQLHLHIQWELQWFKQNSSSLVLLKILCGKTSCVDQTKIVFFLIMNDSALCQYKINLLCFSVNHFFQILYLIMQSTYI